MSRPREDCPERVFQSRVLRLARAHGYLAYHVPDSRGATSSGYPDVTAVHPGTGRLLFLELKSATGRVRPEQRLWIEALRAAGRDVRVIRPSDWDDLVRDFAAGAISPARPVDYDDDNAEST